MPTWRTLISLIRAGETAVAVGFWVAAITAADLVISAVLFICAATVVFVAWGLTPRIKRERRIVIVACAVLACVLGYVLVASRHQSTHSASSPRGPVPLDAPFRFRFAGQEDVLLKPVLRSLNCDIVAIDGYSDLAGTRAEQAWVRQAYPNFDFEGQALVEVDIGRSKPLTLDMVQIKLPSGQKKVIFFDITSTFWPAGNDTDRSQELRKYRRKVCGG